jgi:hypothetical protein
MPARDGEHIAFSLSSDAQFHDDSLVAVFVLSLQIVEKSPSLTDHFQKAPPAVVILFMDLEMLRKIGDPLGENRHLHLGRTGITVVTFVGVDDLLFFFGNQHAVTPPFLSSELYGLCAYF